MVRSKQRTSLTFLQAGALQYESEYDEFGQVYIVAMAQQGSPVDVFQATEIVKHSLHPYGQLFAFMVLSTCHDGSFRAIAEFCDANAAISAVPNRQSSTVLNVSFPSLSIDNCNTPNNEDAVQGLRIQLSLHDLQEAPEHELARAFQSMDMDTDGDGFRQRRGEPHLASTRPVATNGGQFSPAMTMYPVMVQSPLAPNMSFLLDRFPHSVQANPIMNHMSPPYQIIGSLYRTPPSPALTVSNNQSPSRSMSGYGRTDARRQNATRVNRSPHHNAASHHNHVDIHRIREGIDVRITVRHDM